MPQTTLCDVIADEILEWGALLKCSRDMMRAVKPDASRAYWEGRVDELETRITRLVECLHSIDNQPTEE